MDSSIFDNKTALRSGSSSHWLASATGIMLKEYKWRPWGMRCGERCLLRRYWIQVWAGKKSFFCKITRICSCFST